VVPNNSKGETLNILVNHGMRDLFVRQIFTTAATMAGGVVLARVLDPAEFGTYAIATFIVNIFMIFGDLGLGPAFIQSAAAPTDRDLQISFTIQFCLATTVILLTWGLAPWIIGVYPALGPNGLRLARVISLLLYIPCFRSISMVQLERVLNFRPIAWSEGVGISLYQVVAVIGALAGLGVWSFVLATFAAGIFACTFTYCAAPWPVRLRFDSTEMRRILKQGISFQSTSIVDVLSQWATPAIVGTLVGPTAVGYIGMALANARRPLLLAESVMRVTFPHFSRLQEDSEKLHDTINDYLIALLWIMVLWTGFLWSSSTPLVTIVYSPKWLPAVPALIVFALALPVDIIIWTLGLSYRATNQNWRALKAFGVRTAVNLTLASLFVPRFGFVGIPCAYLIANFACAGLLFRGFAKGLFTRIVWTGWWLIPSVLFGYFCSRVSAQAFVPAGSTGAIPVLLVSSFSYISAYLIASSVLAPKEYRDRIFHWARGVVLARRQGGPGTQDVFRAPQYSVVPHPESLGCAGSED
jgi:PST family polysaccharide transporter